MYAKGTEWRKWDLHIHTPDSIRNGYRGTDPWGRFLDELAALPREISVIGINDYWFLDGYKRVRAEFEQGRLPNLHEVFPVIEVRTAEFGGVDGKLRKINLHFICDPGLSPEVIDRQLISALKPTFRLNEGDPRDVWSQIPSLESFASLGNAIKRNVPAEELHRYESDVVEGFNNVCVPHKQAIEAVKDNSILRDRVLIAVGKTEWAALAWNNQSIATKKSLINSADVVFTAASSRDSFHASHRALKTAGVNSRLLDCSDSHYWTDSTEKDRLGNSLTWINADPSFNGLQHAIQEYEHRVSVDDRPLLLARCATKPSTILSKLRIEPRTGSQAPDSSLFDCEVELNPGYIVVLGNKGQGKSALLDIIAAASNSDRHRDYSFLTTERFRRRNGEAGQYRATLTWLDGSEKTITLDEPFSESSPVRVDYLPQSLIERVCLADPTSRQAKQFEAEIERVVFGHVPPSERGDATSLRQMVDARSATIRQRLEAARVSISEAATDIATLEDRSVHLRKLDLDSRLKEVTANRSAIEAKMAELRQELVKRQSGTASNELQEALDVAEAGLTLLLEQRAAKLASVHSAEARLRRVRDLRARVEEETASVRRAVDDLGDAMGDSSVNLLTVNFESARVDAWCSSLESQIQEDRRAVEDRERGIDTQIATAQREISELKARLSEQVQGAEAILSEIADMDSRLGHLQGDVSNPDSESGIRALIDERDNIPRRQLDATAKLRAAFMAAHAAAMQIYNLERSAYEGAMEFVSSSHLASNVDLQFDVELNARAFAPSWSDLVDKRRVGDLQEMIEDRRGDLLLRDVDLSSAEQLFDALSNVLLKLNHDRCDLGREWRPISSVIRSGRSARQLVSAIFDLRWLEGEYVIRSSGQELSELSPGQRGLVLLIFYLLVDKSDRPLLLDQPEENLDNQTVRDMLIPALKDAIKRRQVIVVTHSPNLAIVGDADQLIAAAFDGHRFEYRTGSLERRSIGTQSINVLEGTRAAFDNRELKYDCVVGRGDDDPLPA